jgi:CHRD domain/Secretion system C-terminal sorting domain
MKPFRSAFVLLAILVVGYGTALSQQFFTLAFDGSDSSQIVNTPGRGSGWAILSANRTRLDYTFAYTRLTARATVAHFHSGRRGQAGGVVFDITNVLTKDSSGFVSGSWTNISPANADLLVSGGLYLNIHTGNFPGGEIRAQVNLASGAGYSINLSGANGVPPIQTPGRGAGYAVLRQSDSTLAYRATVFGLTGPITVSHFHVGAAGISGGVATPISFVTSGGNTTDSTWKLNTTSFDNLGAERLYMNVHTAMNAGGEIRGQVRTLAFNVVGVRQVAGTSLAMRITPNPATDMVTMNVALPQAGNVSMRVYDALGRAVSEVIEGTWTSGSASARFNVSSYTTGMYYCRISLASGETVVQGFVVVR